MQFTLIQSDHPAILTKRFERGKDGALTKNVMATSPGAGDHRDGVGHAGLRRLR